MKCNRCGNDFGEGLNCQHCGIDRVEGLGNFAGFRADSGNSRLTPGTTTPGGIAVSNTGGMLCFSCGEIIPNEAEYCPFCQKEQYVNCPKCGFRYLAQFPNCYKCGTNRDRIEQKKNSIICVNCGHANTRGSRYCSICGTQLVDSNCDHITLGIMYDRCKDLGRNIADNQSILKNSLTETNNRSVRIVQLQGITILESPDNFSFIINGVKQEHRYSYVNLWREWRHGYLFVVKQLGGGRRRAILNFSRKDNSLKRVSDFIFPDVDFDGDIIYGKSCLVDYVFGGKKRIVSEVSSIFTTPALRVPLAMNSIDNIPSDGAGEAWLVLSLENEYPLLYFYELTKKNAVVVWHYAAKRRWSWRLYENDLY